MTVPVSQRDWPTRQLSLTDQNGRDTVTHVGFLLTLLEQK